MAHTPSGYIPEGGVWTAEEREANWKDVNLTGNPAVARVIDKADATVAALIEALGDLARVASGAFPEADEDDPIAVDAWKKIDNARALLDSLK